MYETGALGMTLPFLPTEIGERFKGARESFSVSRPLYALDKSLKQSLRLNWTPDGFTLASQSSGLYNAS